MTEPRILLIEDDASLRNLLQEELALDGHRVQAAASVDEAIAMVSAQAPDLVVSDLRLPDGDGLQVLRQLQAGGHTLPFIVITAFGTVDQAVEALQAGADDFLTKPLSTEHLRLKVRRLLAQSALSDELARYRSQAKEPATLGLVGQSRAMERLRQEIRQVARSQAVVLIHGESGTGKELVARAIHEESAQREGPFIPVNCAGIPQELMESEFFGHEAGAFTGALQARKGLFSEADGGTLLLDEIGEMPLALQAKLLRVLQEGTVKPVGAEREEAVRVRVLAATHVNLMEAVQRGAFREDLYYRLETLALEVPPLREREDDVELLAMHFLQQASRRHGRGFMKLSEASRQALVDYPFPGNVRELASAIERAVTFCEDGTVHPEHLPGRIRKRQLAPPAKAPARAGDLLPEGRSLSEWPTLEQVQTTYVTQVMKAVEGNKQRAARILGINRRTLYRWLETREEWS